MILFDGLYDGKTEIKNIIFDWGGVITDLHFDNTKKGFQDLGLNIIDEWRPHEPMKKIFLPFEIGTISSGEFRNRLRELTPRQITDEMIDSAWNSMLGKLPAERWKVLESAGRVYRTFLLSNTNAIHVEYYSNYLKGIYGTYGYMHLFEKVYFSYKLHLRKPNLDIFEYVIFDSQIKPEETLFIDDSIDNIETARSLGFQTVHLQSPLTLADLFTNQPQ
jgi:glucose-1-phosphatase